MVDSPSGASCPDDCMYPVTVRSDAHLRVFFNKKSVMITVCYDVNCIWCGEKKSVMITVCYKVNCLWCNCRLIAYGLAWYILPFNCLWFGMA